MRSEIMVDFSLEAWTRHDKEASVHVGFIPSLKIYSQAATEAELQKALTSAAELFIVACYNRNILNRVLRERGMTKANVRDEAAAKAQQYIRISEYQSLYEKPIRLTIPIDLLAAQEVREAELA